MTTPTLTTEPLALCEALRRIEARRRAALRPSWWQRHFPQFVPHARREHVARFSPTEVIHSNLPS